MQFSLATLITLPLLAAAVPVTKPVTPLTVQAGQPEFNHGRAGDLGNCASVDYARCAAAVKNPAYSWPTAPNKQWYQCWSGDGGKKANCYVWDGNF